MGPDIKKTFLFSLTFLILILSGCSNTPAELKGASIGVIFDYANDTDFPTAHLSVFAESGHNVRRCKEINLNSKETDYSWNTDTLVKYQFNNKYFAGYTNFVMPEGEKIPAGKYDITYVELDGKTASFTGRLRYNSDFYNANVSNAEDIISASKFEKKLVVFDANQVLIYFGEINAEHKNNKNILNRYKGAETKRIVWVSNDKSVLCLMPPEKLNLEQSKEE